MFHISNGEGFLPACESVRISVRLNAGIMITTTPKFDVFLREATAKDRLHNNPGIFWSENTARVRKHVFCEIEGNVIERCSPDQLPAHLPPTGHILNLMVKNVSKGDPLTRDEAEV
jgi:hypothetical protein